ncbi:MAG: peroxiredoxin [Bdellovibrionota bacterium]
MSIGNLLGMGLAEGSVAPDFSLKAADHKIHTLSQYRGQKILLYFYPQAFTPGCTAQACSFRDEYTSLRNQGFTLLGVSTDEVSALQSFTQKYKLPFAVLSDANKKVSKAYQVLMPLVGKSNRVTFLIDEEGIIKKVFRFLPWKTYAQSIVEKNSF